ncbi:Acetyltransferase [Planctomycetales bacterium 10988]|nr:Acetyltransferase [Planctomycetales bacterium 10988]
MVYLRAYHPDDALPLLELFRDTIRLVNYRDYSPEQIAAWASDQIDPTAWAERFQGRFVVVAMQGGKQVGFAELEESGHLDRFYVAAEAIGQGIGKKLMKVLTRQASRLKLSRIFVEASITALPFFERQGFSVITSQTVTLRGIDFLNYHMEKLL